MDRLNWARVACAALFLCVATAISLSAQTFTTLHSFDFTDGANPHAALVQGIDGNLYGTTADGGGGSCSDNSPYCGTIYRIVPGGTLTTLYQFCSKTNCTDGQQPYGSLLQDSDGNYYGTTTDGGTSSACENGCGTVFKITRIGSLTTLYSFCSQSGCADGQFPSSGLIQASDGSLYGTTLSGGTGTSCSGGCGTVFKITTGGTLTTLHSFDMTDGSQPNGPLVQASNGILYGTTATGATVINQTCPAGCGTAFKITQSGTLTTLYNFCSQTGCTDGAEPGAGLIQATNGALYGETLSTVFKMSLSGSLTTLYTFCSQSNCPDGSEATGGLVQATDGNFYGTTSYGGNTTSSCPAAAAGCGTVFEVTPTGTLTTLHDFCAQSECADGMTPEAGLVQDTNGKLYGTTFYGGTVNASCSSGCGTIFSIGVGLGAFVKTQPGSAKVGQTIDILGTSLAGSTSVTFNGTAAVFTVQSTTLIRATVPSGATTGPVQVVTPHGTFSSNVPFRVLP